MKKLRNFDLKLDKEVISLLSVNELNGVKGGINTGEITTLPNTTKEGKSICVICNLTKFATSCGGNACVSKRPCFVSDLNDCPVEIG